MRKFFTLAQDPVSCETHAIGAVLALFGAFLFLARALAAQVSTQSLAAAMCFCLSMIALYSASPQGSSGFCGSWTTA